MKKWNFNSNQDIYDFAVYLRQEAQARGRADISAAIAAAIEAGRFTASEFLGELMLAFRNVADQVRGSFPPDDYVALQEAISAIHDAFERANKGGR
jgi:hypothetical protein